MAAKDLPPLILKKAMNDMDIKEIEVEGEEANHQDFDDSNKK